MLSTGVLVMVALVGLAVALVVLAARRSNASAFVSLCWMPLAVLIVTLVAHERLGLAVLAILGVIVFVSVSLVGYGVALIIRAVRQGSASASKLMGGTLCAGMPLLVLAALWVIQTLRAR